MTQSPPVPRRQFLSGGVAITAGVAGGVASGVFGATAASAAPTTAPETALTTVPDTAPDNVLRPPRLRRGDVVRLVSPASSASQRQSQVDRGVELLREWGLEVQFAEHAMSRYGYLAATDTDRLADLNAAFADPEVRGVICIRGGYGIQRIADGVDLDAVRRDPKPFVGFSDITGLQLPLWHHLGLATIHGPMAAWSDTRTPAECAEALRDALMTTREIVVRRNPDQLGASVEVPGRATGVLVGGNLSLLAAAVGTGDVRSLRGAILFIEDVGEAPYRLDRMLTQVRRSGVLDGLAGVAVGQFVGCEGDPGEWTLDEMLSDRLSDLGVPVLSGLPVGHGYGQLTIPLGVPGTIDTSAGTLVAEPAVD